MNDGNVNNNNKTNANYVWPVRFREWCSLTPPLIPLLDKRGKGELFSFESLYRCYVKCRKNKRNTINALKFEVNAEENLMALVDELNNGTYQPSRSVCFVVERPKMREIVAADFRDRVVHHALVAQLEPVYERIFIHDSYACRKDKGVHRAVERVREFMRKAGRNGNRRLYFLHLDIRNFFMTIDKNVLYGMLEKKIRSYYKQPPAPPLLRGNVGGELIERLNRHNLKVMLANSPLEKGEKGGCDLTWPLLHLAHTIIFHNPVDNCIIKGQQDLFKHLPPHKSLFHAPENRGLPVGNLTSQFFANVYLNELDQYVKHILKCKYYIRYCDDFVLLHESPEKLAGLRARIKTFVNERLGLELNAKYHNILPVSNGIDFLGFIVRPGYTLVRRRVVNNLRTRLNEFEKRLLTTPLTPPFPLLDKRGKGELFLTGSERVSMGLSLFTDEAKQSRRIGTVPGRVEGLDARLRPSGMTAKVAHEPVSIVKYDYELLEKLLSVLASYFGHMKWANSFRLRKALVARYAFLKEFFYINVPNGLVPLFRFRTQFPSVKHGYRYYAARFSTAAVFYQVGCFYEFYGPLARRVREVLGVKPMKKNTRGALFGFPVRLEKEYAGKLLQKGISVVIVRETDRYIGRVKERLPKCKLVQVKTDVTP
jgi:retron-type reverse transcriptase